MVHVSPTSFQVRRNWFHLSQLATIVAMGLRKPYAKSDLGMNLVMYDVYWLTMMLLFMRSKYLEYIASIRIMQCIIHITGNKNGTYTGRLTGLSAQYIVRVTGISWGILLDTWGTYAQSHGGSPWLSPLRSEDSHNDQVWRGGPCYLRPRVSKVVQGTQDIQVGG